MESVMCKNVNIKLTKFDERGRFLAKLWICKQIVRRLGFAGVLLHKLIGLLFVLFRLISE